jgi:hypothetical protein
LGEEYRSLRSDSFLQSTLTLSLLGPNTIQPMAYRILFHSPISRNFKSTPLGSVSVRPYVKLQALSPRSNLVSTRGAFRRYTLSSLFSLDPSISTTGHKRRHFSSVPIVCLTTMWNNLQLHKSTKSLPHIVESHVNYTSITIVARLQTSS